MHTDLTRSMTAEFPNIRVWDDRDDQLADRDFARANRNVDVLIAEILVGTTKLLTAPQARWIGSQPKFAPRIYFANHTSHLDFLLIWSALPRQLRWRTHPVAACDYWRDNPVRHYLSAKVFRGVFVDRNRHDRTSSPIQPILETVRRGESVIVFPEGTRGSGDTLQEFKAGVFYLACECRNIEFVPVWIANANRVMPKGALIPVPLLCSVTFGQSMQRRDDEDKESFLSRLRLQLMELSGL